MRKLIISILLGFTMSAFSTEQVKSETPATGEAKATVKSETPSSVKAGATWDESGGVEKGATWDESPGPVYYLYPPYNNKGEFVRTPAKIFGAIGIIPGSVVGAVAGLPLLPWQTYPTTILACNTFFGQGFSMIFGTPFYVLKIIFWDVPSSWFE